MKIEKPIFLKPGYTVVQITRERYDEFRAVHEPIIFPNRFDLNMRGAYSATELANMDRLSQNLQGRDEIRLGFFYEQEMIGWTYGIQVSEDTFRMVTTGIVAEHQNKGVYSEFLKIYLNMIREAGYQVVFSRHYITDNQVIVPKLKGGFVISGFEATDEYGMLVRLCYYFNPTRKLAAHMRSGFQQADEKLKSLIRKYKE